MSDLHNPHDKFFKETFSHHEVVVDFVKHYLPEEILAIIDVTTIKALKDSFIEKKLTDYYSDLLFQVSYGERECYLYFLFEHKSYPEKTIAFQLLRYMLEIWQREIDKENMSELPIILPIVFYQGNTKWKTPLTITDWLGGNDEVELSLRKFIPHFEILFYDFSESSDTEIRGSAKLQAYLQLIKHIYSDNPKWFYSIIVQLDQAKELNYFETVVIYILNVQESISLDAIKERLTVEGRKKLMTMAEKLRQEGRREGRQEGKQEGIEVGLKKGVHKGVQKVARNMLIKNIDVQEIMDMTDLTKEEIEEIRRTLEK